MPVVVKIGQKEVPLALVFLAGDSLRGGRINSPGVLAGERTNEVKREAGGLLGDRHDLFNVVRIQIHAQSVGQIIVLEKDPPVVFHLVNAEQDHVASGRS